MMRPPILDLRQHIPFEEWRQAHVLAAWSTTPTAAIDEAMQLWNRAFVAAEFGTNDPALTDWPDAPLPAPLPECDPPLPDSQLANGGACS